MGTFCELTINGYDIFEIKNSYQSEVINLIFDESDFLVEQAAGDDYISKKFVSQAGICKKRLEIYGNSLSKSKADFNLALKKHKDEYENTFDNEMEISFEYYQEIIRASILSGEKNHEECDDYFSTNFEKFIKSNDLGVPYQRLESLLWSIFDSIDKDIKIVYDLTFIIESGWITSQPEKELDFQKIIILTEGKTDTEFIKKGINLFYPYLNSRYHFMDFENSNYESSASRLVQTVKAFVGSGIKNKIVALFDNDTAGIKEINNLKRTKFPENIKIFKYPHNSLAENYPTQGPNGLSLMDVNNLGCSIEMYLGEKSLLLETSFFPVQWKGYDDKLEQYQGEVRDKKAIQRSFRNLYKNNFFTNENIDCELPELKKIIDLILNSWNDRS
ncbi:HEPN/Toprim-associated domain-containing protein [Zobellia galactanivorans]|uniref:HEPN/Toprim-associated domain-containing protein n=1 Tax=Zobellia galactanivorans (strain DSM 12802 / CCUG 47099 / CIP 106680 / NCIMB 13871 / Dsij) TaxID=63186 RepID=UPI001C078ABA|nr:HEPN/Toprim-associated domain-containing protein [Zobellia galactanivorans]MBU3026110.1 hypothetical protein [Zobellia galactanivorans]